MDNMSKKMLYKVCLTGGPCAGKTTALTKLMAKFSTDFMLSPLKMFALKIGAKEI